VSPHATYLFKHALVQEAAYGTLVRQPRHALHARIADTLENQFADVAEGQPEVLARHCTEAGLIDKAAALWGKAGLRSQARSALMEAAEQLTRALDQIGTLPSTPALRREQMKFQMALANAHMHTKGFAAPETKASLDDARTLIERAEALGDSLENSLALFSVLYGYWVASYVGFDGDVMRSLAAQFLAGAEKSGATVPLMIGHRIMGVSLLFTGSITRARAHFDRALALYNPAEHGQLAHLFGQDGRITTLFYRAYTLWVLGYPDVAMADTNQALRYAREIGQPAGLMHAHNHAALVYLFCGKYVEGNALIDEALALADEKGSAFWKNHATAHQGCIFALTGKPADAVQTLTSVIDRRLSTGSKNWHTWNLTHLTRAYAELCQFDEARRCGDEAIAMVEATKETWCEAEVYRVAGETVLASPHLDKAKAASYFERALAIARDQQAKSWELRASMSMSRLWRDQGKRDEARELLAPVYGWFTEGFDTLDLKQAKALLNELAQ
jgi:predicted ATPase